ncbi:hypothetical protein MKQ68_05970 [Chitinophaga horti]|uniref:Uncharacterized protein n=1 Tax=Chitinophaga horti TaxID=2920382 RepID=A0ABY6J8K3_9BACT|nr:hypothetical protein [Chitinophaga horti]UYQ94637.1 hypothetical protein MKQ68_05970 [Chitinophaga horti]
MLLLFVFNPFKQTLAEGSKEMNANGGSRAFMYSTTVPNATNIYPTLGTVKVFVRPGETIHVGSSAQGIGGGYIVLRAPNGTTYSTQNYGATGRITNRSQEVAGPFILLLNLGGYASATFPVSNTQGGIWEIDFLPPNANSTTQPAAISASGNWTQPNTAYIAAFDVSVRNTANTGWVTGRTYTNIFTGSLGNFNQPFNALFYALTRDGYRYTINNNGQTGYGFSFFVNNKGVQTAAGEPSYKSFNDLSGFNMQDPREEDTETDYTAKLFFNAPDETMPTSATTRTGTTWLITQPTSPVATNYSFRGRKVRRTWPVQTRRAVISGSRPTLPPTMQ